MEISILLIVVIIESSASFRILSLYLQELVVQDLLVMATSALLNSPSGVCQTPAGAIFIYYGLIK